MNAWLKSGLKISAILPIAFLVFVVVGLIGDYVSLYQKARELTRSGAEQSATIRRIAERDSQIEAVLKDLLVRVVPGSYFARVSIVYDYGKDNVGHVPLYRIDNTHVAFLAGSPVPIQQTDIPLSQWAAEIAEFTSGHCVARWVDELSNLSYKARLERSNIQSFVACPLVDSKEQFFGAVLLSWSEKIPKETLSQYTEAVNSAAQKVAKLLGAE